MAEDNAPHGNLQMPDQEANDARDKDENPRNSENEKSEGKEDGAGTPPPEPEPLKQNWTGRVASAAIVLLAIMVIAIVIAITNRYPRTDDAEVFANYIGLAPVVNGPISDVYVRDNQQVHEGDVLFRVDERPYRYALERAFSDRVALEGQIVDESRRIRALESATQGAQAATRTAVANVGRSTSAVDQATADVGNAQASLARAKTVYAYSLNNLHRVEPLLAKQFVTVDQVDQLRTGTAANELAVRQAEAQVKVAQAALASSYAALTASNSSVFQSQAQQRQSQNSITTLEPFTGQRGARESAIETAQYNLNHCDVKAPFDARVTNLTLSQGAYARAGTQVFTLIDTRVWWVIANFRETQLRHILPGMHVDVYLLGDPDRLYRGVVDSASFGVTPDASTLGTLAPGLPDAQRTLSWVHLASRYPVRIRILDPQPNAFRIAQSATVVVRGWKGW
jgi:multidrug efflux system membrane fusion protein